MIGGTSDNIVETYPLHTKKEAEPDIEDIEDSSEDDVSDVSILTSPISSILECLTDTHEPMA